MNIWKNEIEMICNMEIRQTRLHKLLSRWKSLGKSKTEILDFFSVPCRLETDVDLLP